jgi:hypothetical protein
MTFKRLDMYASSQSLMPKFFSKWFVVTMKKMLRP